MPSADEKLLRQLDSRRGGDHAARSLYRAYGHELFGFALQRLGDRGAAEEVVQDVFARAWHHAGDYDAGRGSVRTWLYGIARNAIVDAQRRRARRPDLATAPAHDQVDDDEPIERALLRWQVQLALSRLAPDHREVIELVHVRGLKLQEIADRLGLPLGTVKSRLYYALKGMRLVLEEQGVQP
ncbi:MAG: sigma-70 family RNA polymerase sigma factor [Actinomycetota bacterium]|nr:sigma-70 family RNA polymerase sigma factor [Actinomycetota bacterium]